MRSVRVAVYGIVLSLSKCMCHDKAIVAGDCRLAPTQSVCEGESCAPRPQAATAFSVCLDTSTTQDLTAKHTITRTDRIMAVNTVKY